MQRYGDHGGEAGVGQHAPQVAPSSAHESPATGSESPQLEVAHSHVVPSHRQLRPGGGPGQVGGHREASIVPGGQVQLPPVQTGPRPESAPQADRQ